MLTSRGFLILIESAITVLLTSTFLYNPQIFLLTIFTHFFIISYIIINFYKLKSYPGETFAAKRFIPYDMIPPEALFEVSATSFSKINDSLVAELREEFPEGVVLVDGTAINRGIIDSNHELRISYRARLSTNSKIGIFKNVDLILYDALMVVGRRLKLEAPGEIFSSEILQGPTRTQLSVRNRIANTPIGISTNPFVGHDEEFINIKTYEDGDSIRYIHWKKTAALQSDDLLVKKFEKLGETRISIVIDCSPSLNAGLLHSYIDTVRLAVLNITRAAIESGNLLKIYLLNPEIPIHHHRKTSIRNFQDALLRTAMIFPTSHEAPSLVNELFNTELQKGSYVAIFTNPPSINSRNLALMINEALGMSCKVMIFIPLIDEYYPTKIGEIDLTQFLKMDMLLKTKWASQYGENVNIVYISPTTYILDIKRIFTRRLS